MVLRPEQFWTNPSERLEGSTRFLLCQSAKAHLDHFSWESEGNYAVEDSKWWVNVPSFI